MSSPDKKSFLLRIDPVLWAEIERLAAGELRSVNAQVEYLLRQSVRSRNGPPGSRDLGSAQPLPDIRRKTR
jgi:hypothetical protein